MELTYYDTRPKDGMATENKREKERSEYSRLNSSSNDAASPRKLGPREVKRRPLPADPSQSIPVGRPPPPAQVQSAPPPQLHRDEPRCNRQQETDEQWAHDPYYHNFTSSVSPRCCDVPSSDRFEHDLSGSTIESGQPQVATHINRSPHSTSSYGNFGHPDEIPGSDGFSSHSAWPSFPATPARPMQHMNPADERHHSAQPLDSMQTRSSLYTTPAPYGSSPPLATQDRSPPGSSNHRNRASFRRYSTSPVKDDVFRDSPLRQSISQHDVDPVSETHYDVSEDEGPPPPPPAHRNTMHASTSSPTAHQDTMRPVQVPQPLNIGSGNHRISPFDRSPLQNIERNYDLKYQNSAEYSEPCGENEKIHSPYSKPTYSAVNQPARRRSRDKPTGGTENTPPILRSGYDRSAEETVESRVHNERLSHRQSLVQAASPPNRDMGVLDNSGSRYQLPQAEDERQVFTSEPPFVKPRAVSPDPRVVPRRKAVSPQQAFPSQDERRLSGIPFGPDSYEVFNPSSPLSSSVAGPESRYETPEQAKEASRQHEVQKLRDQGPIIGNDGRVIDPSDHLPTDTWAPEPERRNRKPEMVIRYRTKETTPRSPHGYGSSPGSARPHSVGGPVNGSSPIATGSPSSLAQQKHGRNRLQKQVSGRPLPVQPYQQTHSSPAIPTANHNTPSPRTYYPPRPDLSEYPLCGQQNQRNSHASSPGAPFVVAPPVPAKVPISPFGSDDKYAGYGSMNALSAELSTIDIGTGMGSRGGRSRRGCG
jgi:hypothetical protein